MRLSVEDLQKDLVKKTWDTIRKTLNKFRRNPYYFFTESDIRAYFYHCLYKSSYEIDRDQRRILLIHTEYPTNFRYKKKEFISYEKAKVYLPNEKKGRRGNYDLVVISPEYCKSTEFVESIVNKNISLLENRYRNDINSVQGELLFTIEFKYITSNNLSWIKQINMDNTKLWFSRKYGSAEAINLIFCNTNYHYKDELKKLILKTPEEINIIVSVSHYDKTKKHTPKNLTNNMHYIHSKGIPVISSE